jgi:hypothetical protein
LKVTQPFSHKVTHPTGFKLCFQRNLCRYAEDEFSRNLRALEEEFDTERQEIVSAHTRQKRDMQDLMQAMVRGVV